MFSAISQRPSPAHANTELEALNRSQAVIYFTPDGTILDANQNFLDAVGYRLEEIKGKHHRIFVDPDYAASTEYRAFWKGISQGDFVADQFRRFGRNGKEIWIQASYNPLFDKAGRVDRVVKYAADITAQKLKNADYEGQLAAINRSQAIIEFNLDGTILSANQNFLDAMGYTLEEIKGKHHRLFAAPDYANSPAYAEFWARLAQGEFVSGEFHRIGKHGKEVWIQASYNPILDMNGTPFKIVKYAADITTQKQKTADAQGQIEAIGKSQAVIEFNLDGTIVTANQNFLDAMGYTLEEIKGKHHRIFVDPEEVNTPEYQGFWQKLAKGEFDMRVYKRRTKSGKDIWIQASYNPILDANGHPFKVVKYATDVTKIIQTGEIAQDVVMRVQSVAAAIEEMTASIAEISKNMTMSRDATTGIIQDAGDSIASANQLTNGMEAMGEDRKSVV